MRSRSIDFDTHTALAGVKPHGKTLQREAMRDGRDERLIHRGAGCEAMALRTLRIPVEVETLDGSFESD